MDEDNLLRAIGNLEIAHQLPPEEVVNEREKQWKKLCLDFSVLFMAWRSRKIDRSLLRGSDAIPRSFLVASEIMQKVFKTKVNEIANVCDLSSCARSRYSDGLKLLLEAEEFYQAVEMRCHDIESQQLVTTFDEETGRLIRFGFNLPNLAFKTPSIMAKDYVVLGTRDGLQLAMQIDNAAHDFIDLPKQAYEKFRRQLDKPVTVAFIPSGIPFAYQQKAVEDLRSREALQRLVFEEVGASPTNKVKIDVVRMGTKQLDERLYKLNACQREAVIGILKAKCRTKPYILFGPPGTGKTHTLVEAIVQVYWRTRLETFPRTFEDALDSDSFAILEHFSNSDSLDTDALGKPKCCGAKILVCINSNNCTDEVHAKIKRELPGVRVVRLSSGNFLNEGDRPNIVVTTNIKAHSLRDTYMFDYVFVDEAGHANVAETLIPACVLKDDGCLVLAGDPKQLGPVVRCQQAAKLGLDISLLERLFKFAIYLREAQTGRYDQRYITMLQDCYRCDPRILITCNKLFYNDKLRCLKKTPRSLLQVLQLTGPVQMRHAAGQERSSMGSTSLYNQAELTVCVDLVKRLYCMGIEPSQIGVTSPYKLQANKIRKALKFGIEKDHQVAGNLKKRFIRYDFTPITRLLKSDEPTEAMVRKLKLPAGSRLFEKLGEDESEQSYVPCDFTSLPADLTSLAVRRVAKLECKVDTIDAFQGGEKEIMIISTVRSQGDRSSLRFVSDPRRFNVAISRAKWLVIVVGNQDVLERAKYWDALLEEAKGEMAGWPRRADCPHPFSQNGLFRAR